MSRTTLLVKARPGARIGCAPYSPGLIKLVRQLATSRPSYGLSHPEGGHADPHQDGGLHQLAMNLRATSVARLRTRRSAIVACFVF
jgi:hypothetical protein